MKVLTDTYSLLTPENARAICAAVQADDDCWTYEVCSDGGSPYCFIQILDERGIILGRL